MLGLLSLHIVLCSVRMLKRNVICLQVVKQAHTYTSSIFLFQNAAGVVCYVWVWCVREFTGVFVLACLRMCVHVRVHAFV